MRCCGCVQGRSSDGSSRKAGEGAAAFAVGRHIKEGSDCDARQQTTYLLTLPNTHATRYILTGGGGRHGQVPATRHACSQRDDEVAGNRKSEILNLCGLTSK